MRTSHDTLKHIVGTVNWNYYSKTAILKFNYLDVNYSVQYDRTGSTLKHVFTWHDSKDSMQSELVLEVLRSVVSVS